MFMIEVKFKVSNSEVSLEKFAKLLLVDVLRAARSDIREYSLPVKAPRQREPRAKTEPIEAGVNEAAQASGDREGGLVGDRFIPVQEAFRTIGVSTSKGYLLARNGKIPIRKLGRKSGVLQSDLVQYLKCLPLKDGESEPHREKVTCPPETVPRLMRV